MFFRKPTASQNHSAPDHNRRRAERIQTAILSCELGQILDISRKGLRISAAPNRPRPATGQQLSLSISSPTDALDLVAKVIRVRPIGMGRFELALDFAPMTDAQADAIESLARIGSTRAAMHTDAARRERLIAAMKVPDHYATLGVSPKATPEQVQAAFRTMARKYHPDVNKDPSAQPRFVEINEAHTILCDPQRRAEYDQVYSLRAAA